MARPSPLQNRVTPFGQVMATPERGLWMGNRGGCFHDAEQRLTASRWVNTHWITCRLEFKGWHRAVMQPRRYTELFFLDEATAFAAGHRPCFECRRHDARAFQAAWLAANPGEVPGEDRRIAAVDAVLQRERVTRKRQQVTFEAEIGEMPEGVFVSRAAHADIAWLLWEGCLRRWTPAGYASPEPAAAAETVTVLTPRSIVRTFAADCRPTVHPTASG
jgi:hypothetical protein